MSHGQQVRRRGIVRSAVAVGIAAALSATSAVAFEAFPGAQDVERAFSAHGRYLAELGRAHEHGEGVSRDPARAALLYCEAVRLGDVEATFALGWMFANGRGLARSDERATYLFRRAAERGHDHARQMLRYTEGETVEMPECLAPRASDALFAWSERVETRLRRLPAPRQQIARLIIDLAPQFQVSPAFALAIGLTESALDPHAVSPKNAMGVMQLIPATAARFNVSDIFDPEQNIKGGLSYLRWLLAYFEGDVALVAAAYNAGERAVERYGGVPPFRETRNYVERVMFLVQSRNHAFDSRIVSPSQILSGARLASQEPGT